MALRVSVGALKLYCRVSRSELPIHFFGNFYCWTYRLATKGEKADVHHEADFSSQLSR